NVTDPSAFMSRLSREHLLGFLLDSLAPDEQQQVEAELNQNPKLRDELKSLESHLKPLGMCERPQPIDPPPGLAARTCNFVAAHSAALVGPAGGLIFQSVERERRFTWSDFVTMAAV